MQQDRDAESRIAQLDADNRRLRRLLEQRDAPAELRHRLQGTVAMMRLIIRRTAETERDLDSYVGHVEDRLDALMRAQAAADERGSVNLHSLLTDELHRYGISEGEGAALDGPEIELRPRPGQILALAIHELVINAVEHGQADGDSGYIRAIWSLVGTLERPEVLFEWTETGDRPVSVVQRPGFGTEVLHQSLAYELNAHTAVTIRPNGLQCTIRFPLPETIGAMIEG